jgi:hypothetical protein
MTLVPTAFRTKLSGKARSSPCIAFRHAPAANLSAVTHEIPGHTGRAGAVQAFGGDLSRLIPVLHPTLKWPQSLS